MREPIRKAAKTPVYLKCAHPECTADFDYGHGRFFRFRQFPRQEPLPANGPCVKHFWLCARCCESFTIDYQRDVGVILRQRLDTLTGCQPSHFVLQVERAANRRLARRIGRAKVPSRKSEFTHGQTNTIEILENRNLGRRG